MQYIRSGYKTVQKHAAHFLGVLLSCALLIQATLPGLLSLAGQQAEKQPFFVELCTSNGFERIAIDQPNAVQAQSSSIPHDMQAHCPLCIIAGDTSETPDIEPNAAGYYLVFTTGFPVWETPFHHKHLGYLLPDVRGSPLAFSAQV